ncbi:MAG: hypothetical protein IPJ33_05630 [Gammaproteobacteria bacterium]|nr:hypothetical protein [Gammaproteobacteria bacterium]MBP6053662.1 hypothetical protein [Pseudomonadales bacterium]
MSISQNRQQAEARPRPSIDNLQPCPHCGGIDRFRVDDSHGNAAYCRKHTEPEPEVMLNAVCLSCVINGIHYRLEPRIVERGAV